MCSLLGHELSFNRIRPLLKRLQGISDYATPKSRGERQRVLGMMNYDRSFIPGITELPNQFYGLLQKGVKFVWTEEDEDAFTKIKEIWKTSLELFIPDLDKRFTLECDAFNVGIGDIVTAERPVVYISRSLNKSEVNYPITEKEVLAAIWSMEKLKYYLTEKEFELITDHKAI